MLAFVLAPRGDVLALAPSRGSSLDAFVAAARARTAGADDSRPLWAVTVDTRYDAALGAQHDELVGHAGYDPDTHYPWLVHVRRCTEN